MEIGEAIYLLSIRIGNEVNSVQGGTADGKQAGNIGFIDLNAVSLVQHIAENPGSGYGPAELGSGNGRTVIIDRDLER